MSAGAAESADVDVYAHQIPLAVKGVAAQTVFGRAGVVLFADLNAPTPSSPGADRVSQFRGKWILEFVEKADAQSR